MSIFLSKKIQYFLVVMETQNLTTAAELLHITRSPIGKSIVDLEESLGKKLFIRKGNKIEPTEIAENLYKKTKPLSDSLMQIESDFSSRNHFRKIKLIVDTMLPSSVAATLEPLSKIKGFNLYIERQRYDAPAIEESLLSEKSAFLTIRHDWGGLTKDYYVEEFSPLKIYLLCANNIHNQHATLDDILSRTPLLKSDFVSDQVYTEVLMKHITELKKTPVYIHGTFDVAASLNLVSTGKVSMIITESLLKYCHTQIKTILIKDLELIPKLVYHTKHKKDKEFIGLSDFIKKGI